MKRTNAPPWTSSLKFLLVLSLVAFGLDLAHMIYHLLDEPLLLRMEGAPVKLLAKTLMVLIPTLLLIGRRVWRGWLGILFLWTVMVPQNAWALSRTGCQHARELLEKSGTARDASENLFGRVKIKPPHGSFPSDIDKITWWGTFKPFEFWESPEFESVWINPQGQEVARRQFRGKKCQLAKDTLQAEDQPRGQFQSGMWNVIVTCEDYLIDKQSVAVLSAGGSPTSPDAPSKPQETAMIWAKDKVKD